MAEEAKQKSTSRGMKDGEIPLPLKVLFCYYIHNQRGVPPFISS